MMSSGTLMGNDGNAAGGYGTLRSTGGQMFDALSDKVNILKLKSLAFFLSKYVTTSY